MNTKKWLALLTALMMLSASMAAVADSPNDMVNKAYENGQLVCTYVSATPRALPLDESTKTVVTDLLKSLMVEFITLKGSDASQAQAIVYLGETEALNVAWIASNKNDDTFISTSLLGNEALYVNFQDIAGLYIRLIDTALSMDTTSSQAEKDAFINYLQNYLGAMVINALSPDADATSASAFFSSPKAEALMAKVSQSIVTTQGTFETKYHDPATTHMVLTITKEDIITAFQIVLDQQETTSDNLAAQFIEMLPAAMDEAFHYDSIPVDIYLNAIGQVVCINVLFQNDIAGDSTCSITYSRQTQADNTAVHMIQGAQTFGLPNDGCHMAISFLEGSDTLDQVGFFYRELENAQAANQMSLVFIREKNYADDATASDGSVLMFTMTQGDDVTALELHASTEATFDGKDVHKETWMDLYGAGIEDSLLSIGIITISEDAANLVLPEVSDAVRPGAMTEDEFNQWVAQVQVQLMSSLQTIIMALPSSVQNALMGQ